MYLSLYADLEHSFMFENKTVYQLNISLSTIETKQKMRPNLKVSYENLGSSKKDL